MSQDLKWQLIRGGNAFLVKRDGLTFSREPNNLKNLNSFKYSGLANDKVIGVEVATVVKDKKTKQYPELAIKRQGAAKVSPKRSFAKTLLVRHSINKNCVAAACIRRLSAGSFMRGDLANDAIARYHKLRLGLQSSKAIKKTDRRRNAKKAHVDRKAQKKAQKN
jgi:large subunit ribosomal protein L28e